MPTKISFVGFGRMGSALAMGALAAKVARASDLVAYDPEPSAMRTASRLKIKRVRSEIEAALASDVVFLCVKPQQMSGTLAAMSVLTSAQRRARCFVSIAAGVPLVRLEAALGSGVSVLRVMPNTPALLRSGASALSRGTYAKTAHVQRVRKVLESVGTVAIVDDSHMDAITALSGSGPAYVFYLAEAMATAGVSLGLSTELAQTLVRQTIFGSGAMLHERDEPAEELRRQVTSPGGTTAAAMEIFEERSFKAIVSDAIQAAALRSKELARGGA